MTDIRFAGKESLLQTREAACRFIKDNCYNCMYEYSSTYDEVFDAFKAYLCSQGYEFEEKLLQRRFKRFLYDNFIPKHKVVGNRVIVLRVRLFTTEEDKQYKANGRSLDISAKGKCYEQ